MKNRIEEGVPSIAAWAVKPMVGFFLNRKQSSNKNKGEYNVFLCSKFSNPLSGIIVLSGNRLK
jgi:hypothetical protein